MDDHLNLEDGNDLPPPYSPSVNPASNNIPDQHHNQGASSSIFSPQIAHLRNEIAASQAARATARDASDSYVLSLIVPYVEHFLSSISFIHPTPKLVEATFVPDAAISEEWKLSDEDERRVGEFKKLLRVRDNPKKDGGDVKKRTDGYHSSTPLERVGDEEISTSLWWEDESMAQRLAKHLQPQRTAASKNAELARDRSASQTKSNKKSGLWGLFKRSEEPARSTASMAGDTRDGVVMTARAEEVTFRKENEFGLWETLTGFGIVVSVRIRMTGDVITR